MKYELIKIYQGSPGLGTIIIPTTTSEQCEIFYVLETESDIVTEPYLFPEFWKKVEEVDYEIVALKLSDNTILSYKNGVCIRRSDLLSREDTYSLKESLSKLNLEDHIYSVKRLSDGEVFTIGDRIKGYRHDFPYKVRCNDFVLTKIDLDSNKISLHGEIFSKIQLEIAKKIKKTPLFTTEDGVDIFEGDTFWIIGGENICRFTAGFFHEKISGKRIFSTEELAKESELLNKPCLNLNDIATVLSSSSPLFGKIKELAKSKI